MEVCRCGREQEHQGALADVAAVILDSLRHPVTIGERPQDLRHPRSSARDLLALWTEKTDAFSCINLCISSNVTFDCIFECFGCGLNVDESHGSLDG